MNNWLIAFQTPYNSVKYITNQLASPTFLSYYKFLDYVQTLQIINYNDFVDNIDKFRTIIIDLDNHTWEIYISQKKREVSREELLELNDDSKEEGGEIKKLHKRKFSIKDKVKKIVKKYDFKVRPK